MASFCIARLHLFLGKKCLLMLSSAKKQSASVSMLYGLIELANMVDTLNSTL